MLQQTASDSARGHDVPPPVAGAFKLDDPVQESISHLYLAIELSPKAVPTLAKLARILATDPDPRYRNGNDAVRFAERACQLTDYRQPELVGTLALAYAEAGRFPDAIAAAQQAQMLSGRLGQERLVEVNQEWLDLFRAGRVYREPREFAGIKAIP
jgi:tetratricopeptide (TPR) repeat protein